MSTRIASIVGFLMLAVIAGQGAASAETPTLSIEPTTGPPTTTVVVTGTGFQSDEMVSLFFGTKTRGTTSTDPTGAFSATIAVPRSASAGEHEVTATGQTSLLEASANFTVVLPSITLGRTDGPPMVNVLVTGANFRSLESIEVALDDKLLAHATADQAGAFSTTMRIPQRASAGPHDVTATGGTSGLIAHGTFAVRIDKWPQYGFDAAHSGVNPSEDVLGPSNVGDLTSLWTTTIDPGGGLATGFSSPAVVKGTVYVGSESGGVYALDAWTGEFRWTTDTRTHNWSSPAVAKGVVYIGGGNLLALRASNGAVVWKKNTHADTWTPTVANGVVYIITKEGPAGGGDGSLLAVRASDGSTLWTKRVGYAGDSVTGAAPTVADGLVYVGSESHELYALDASTGELRWTVPMGEVAGTTPSVADGVAYAPSEEHLRALDASTGTVIWTAAVGPGASSPAIEDGVLYVGGGGGLSAVDASTGSIRWTSPLGYSKESSPAVANGVVYVIGNQTVNEPTGKLFALDAITGEVLWTAPIGAYGRPDPRVVNGMVYTASEDGRVYAFALP